MLKESLKGLARSLPTMFGLAGGLGRALTGKDEPVSLQPAACFPKPGKEHEAAESPAETHEKE